MNLSIVLPLRNVATLSNLLSQLYDPSSPNYHHFLSVDEFTAQFGPTAEDYRTVVAFAKANGFTVTDQPANRLIVPLSGTVVQINAAFHVQMNNYQHPTEDRTFYSPDREPSLNLGVPVAHVSGLDNYSLPQPMAEQPQDGQPISYVAGSGPGGTSYLGSDMRAAYYGGTTLTGTGQVVGLLEFVGYNQSDVDLTFSKAGQTYSVPIVNVLLDGATGAATSRSGEDVLDIVQAIGMAPGLKQVRVYIGVSNDATILNSMATENLAKQIGISWSWRPADPTVDDVFFEEFAAQGQSVFVASGDHGAFDSAISPFFYPADDEYVTAVGGTHLTTNGAAGSWQSETVWNTTSKGTGSGGGISPDGIAIPSWQAGVATSANGGSITLRNVPDVAMEGDYDNYSCSAGTCSGGWAGTSFAAPRWAGFMALVNQQAVEAGTAPAGGIGFINPALYTLASGTSYSNDLHDITSGNNDTANQPVWFSATTGYDLTTGWGSPTGQSLIDALAGPQVPGFWIAASAGTLALSQGATGTSTITVTNAGGFTGSVNLAVTSTLPSGVTASWGTNPTTGTSVLTFTASSSVTAGTYPVTITGTSGSLTQTTNIALTVHSPTFTLTPSPSSISLYLGTPSKSTVTVTSLYGFTGSVNLAVTSTLPTGVTASWGTNPTTGTSVLTFTADSTAIAGTSAVTITGTSGSLTQTATISLTLYIPTFTLSTYSSVNIGQGSSGTAYIYVNDQNGFTGSVTLATSGLPSGVTASFSTNPTTSSSTLTLTASSSAPTGQYTVTITGTSGSLTAATTLTVGIFIPTFTLTTYSGVNVGQGSSGTGSINVNGQYGFTGSVNLSVTGLPSGVTASFSPNPTTYFSTLTFTASSSAPTGQYTVTITGTSGSTTVSTTLTLGVYVPTFTLTGSSGVNVGQGSSSSGYVYANAQYGFTGSVTLAASGLPSGVTVSFSPNPTTYFSTLTFTASSSAALGQYTVTITGTSGSQTESTTLTVGVYVPTFTLSNNSSVYIGQGSSGTSYVNANAQYGFTGSVNLVASGLPSGVTAAFSPNPTTSSSTLTFTASSSAPTGQYTVTITGTSGSQTQTTTLTLNVCAPTFTLSDSPTYASLNQNGSVTSTVTISPQYGFSSSVTLSASGLPSGVTASFSPNPTIGSSVLSLTASSTATAGSKTVTITGTSGTTTASTSFYLTVYASTFTLSDAPSTVNLVPGGSDRSTLTVIPQYGFVSSVNLTISGLPNGVSASWGTNPTTGSSVLTLTASSSAAVGTTTATITGTSGSLVATTPLAVVVKAAPTATTTALTVTSSGAPVTSVAAGSVVTLSATVTSGTTALTTGRVNFCDAAATYCEDIHLLGSAQLTSAGTATLKFIPGIGSHSYKAVFSGTNSSSTSSSSASGLTVTGAVPTSTTIAQSGVAGNYSLTATVTATGPIAPTGGVSFLDTSNANAILGSATLGVGTEALSWQTPQSIATSGSSPTSIAAADFNGDGIPDLAIVNYGSNTLTILLGNGDGTFRATAVSPATGAYPMSVVVGDFNGDGKADLAVANYFGNTVTILLGNGDGTFTQAASPSAGYYPTSITTGDFNGDGKTDLAIANSNNNTVTILLGNGDGTFTATAASPSTGNYPRSIVSEDFNGDGIPDLAIANNGSNTVTILLGNGDGTFIPTAASPTTGSSPYSITAGDFNGDGKTDLAVTNYFSNTVTILLGNGDGTFTATALSPATGSDPISIMSGDFNGDGKTDLAVANFYSTTASVLLGNGDGTFTAGTSPSVSTNARAIAASDFNGDGTTDLAVVSSANGNVTVSLAQRTQTAAATATGISPVGQGVHLVDAKYLGDSLYKSSLSGTTGLTALLLPTIIWPTPAAIPYGTALSATQLNASSTVAGSFTYTPAMGTVLGVGLQTLKATFTPTDTTDYATATSSVTLNVTQATPAIALYSSASTAILTNAVTFTANVTSTAGTPSGTVSFYDGSTLLSSATLASGVATYTTSGLAASAHSISAVYSGDTLFTTMTSSVQTQTVEDFTLAPASGSDSATASAGAKASYTLSFAPTVGSTFAGAISFAISGLPTGATATFSPATLQANSAANSVTLTVTLPSQTAALPTRNPLRGSSLPVALGMILLPFVVKRNAVRQSGILRSLTRGGGLAILLLSVAWVATLSGCGGQEPGPTAKTYPLTVTATSSSLSRTITINLTVQ